VNLTMQVAPANAGTTSPPVGVNSEALNSVVVISATANPNYCFQTWTSVPANSVTLPTFATSTVVMDQDRSVTSSFVAADLSLTPIGQLTATVGGTVQATVKVNSLNCFNQQVHLEAPVASLPPGFSVTFNPINVTPPSLQSVTSSM